MQLIQLVYGVVSDLQNVKQGFFTDVRRLDYLLC